MRCERLQRAPFRVDYKNRMIQRSRKFLEITGFTSATGFLSAHSMILSHGNALIYQHKFFSARAQTPCTRYVRNFRS